MNRTGLRAVALVAGREISTRLTSKTFLWITAILVLAVVVGGLVVSATVPAGPPTREVAVTSDLAGLAPTLEAAGTATGVPVEVVTVESPSEGEQMVLAGTVDALLTGTPTQLTVVVDRVLDPALEVVVSVVSQQQALSSEVTALGGDPAAVASTIAAARPTVEAIGAASTVDDAQLVTGMLSGILIFIAITMAGQYVAQGVVEEKTSRVVEILLATVRPWELMAGKVAGIGVIGLVQLVLVIGAGSAVALATGVLGDTGVDLGSTVAWVVVWFLLGFVMYATVLAAAAALVSRQEDVGAVTFPIIMIMMIPYFIGVTVAPNDPDSPLLTNLSMVPLFAPFLMPIRIAQGTAEGWQVAIALVLTLAFIPLLVWVSGLVYKNAVLRTGARVPLREALRSR